MRGKVTMQDIADLAGVSKYAVSRALAGKSGVSAETRELIFRAAGQLGYLSKDTLTTTSDVIQDSEEINVKGTILVLFPNIRHQNRESVYWGPVFEGISKRLNEKGLDILTLTEPSGDRVFSVLNPEAIRGVITVGTISTSILMEIKRLNIPVVMVDHQDPALTCDTIFTDNISCMCRLVAKLISKGYRRFQFVGHIRDAESYFERWLAFRTTLEQFDVSHAQLPELIGPQADQVRQVISSIQEADLPEVFVCANDSIAQKTIETLAARGIEVPQRCAVTGFDNTEQDLPILSTVNVNKEWLGMRAVDQMLWRVLNRDAGYEKKLIVGEVIMREYHSIKID